MVSYLRLLLGIICISFAAIFARATTVPPVISVFYRMVFGGLFMLALIYYRGDKLWQGWLACAVSCFPALCFSLDLYNWHHSIFIIGPGMATLIVNLQVFMVALLGVVFFKEKLNWRFLAAMPVAMLGVYLLVGHQYHTAHYSHGLVLGGIAAMGYACYLIGLRLSTAYQPDGYVYLVYICFLIALILGTVGWIQHASFRIPDIRNLSLLLGYGVICQGIGWLLITSSIKDLDVAMVALLLLLQPALTFCLGYSLFSSRNNRVARTRAFLNLVCHFSG